MNYWNDHAPRLVGLDAIETWDELWIAGDEAEVHTLNYAGFPQALAFIGNVDALLRDHADNLKKPARINLCLPSTPDGRALQEQLASRLGRNRCWLVDWPEACDRASTTEALYSSQKVTDVVLAAHQYPLDGVYQVSAADLHRLRHERQPETMTTGTKATDAIIHMPTEGRLVVVTGYPGAGKTSWVRYVMTHTAAREGRKWLVFSPENSPWEYFMSECAQVFHDKPFWPRGSRAGMTDGEIHQAANWMRDRIIAQVCDAEDKSPTLDWLVRGAEDARIRHGVTDWVIDPFNEVDHQRNGLTEADYINACLRRLKRLANRHAVNVWVLVHPKNPQPLKDGQTREAPGPYDINGGAAWFNKADVGITVHSSVRDYAEIILWKAKFLRFGQRGDRASLLFDPVTGVYHDPGNNGDSSRGADRLDVTRQSGVPRRPQTA